MSNDKPAGVFNRVKVFTATKASQREGLGEAITNWLRIHDVDVLDKTVLQSSDSAFHCVSIVLFCRDRPGSST